MKKRNWKDYILLTIACLTILAGLGQAVMPSVALSSMGVKSPSEATLFFFILLSLIIILFGGLLLHENLLFTYGIPLLWAGLQKIVSVILLIIGILNNLLSNFVWIVAVYDFACGIFLLIIWIMYKKTESFLSHNLR
jgi:hypothetical protein